jgi:selenocysteine lyase/cysteine desulfurase
MLLDHLVGDADQFPILRKWVFFNHAGVSPMPRVATDQLRAIADEADHDAYLSDGWYGWIERLRQAAARIINATPDEIALVKNTGEGLSLVARGIDWKPGDVIVTTAVEYPSNMYPWMDVARRDGATLVCVPPRQDGACTLLDTHAILEAIERPGVRLVTLSHVQFSTCQRLDVATIGRRCREKGICFCVDVIQSMGVLPVDVQAMCIDVAAADGHKWMLGPEGEGIVYVRREWQDRLRPLSIGATTVVNWRDFDTYDFTLHPNARRYECGTHNLPGIRALTASLEMLEKVGIEQVFARVTALGDRLLAGAVEKGWTIACPRDAASRSGAVAIVSANHDPAAVWKTLRKEHRVECAVRGGRLRASPHFYNTEQQVDRFLETLPRA